MTDQQANILIRDLRKSGRFTFCFSLTDSQRQLSKSQQAAILRQAFDRHLSAYFGEINGEPIAIYSNEPERM